MKLVKSKRIILSLLTIMLVSTQLASGQISDTPHIFQITEDHELTILARGSLNWEENQNQILELNFTMSDFRVNESIINVLYIQFDYIDTSTGQVSDSTGNTTDISLVSGNSTHSHQQILAPPRDLDRFYLNVSFQVNAEGGGVNEDPIFESFRFPSDTTIIVQRDNLVPAINLYGFPQGGYFQLWLPIYGTFVFFLLTPSFVVLGSKIKEVRSKGESNPQVEQESDLPKDSDSTKTEINEEEIS